MASLSPSTNYMATINFAMNFRNLHAVASNINVFYLHWQKQHNKPRMSAARTIMMWKTLRSNTIASLCTRMTQRGLKMMITLNWIRFCFALDEDFTCLSEYFYVVRIRLATGPAIQPPQYDTICLRIDQKKKSESKDKFRITRSDHTLPHKCKCSEHVM